MGKGRAPCCDKSQVKKGPWSPAEDLRLITFIQKHGHENWRALPKQAGLLRCGKSCRLRWINYLRPDVKRGNFTKEEEDTIIKLHQTLGNKWSKIASHLPGRTDNEIKNVWNTHLKKKLTFEDTIDSNTDHDQSKESSTTTATTTSSSSSSSSSTVISPANKRNNNASLDHQWTKKPRVLENVQDLKEAEEILLPTSSTCSNNSNVTNHHQLGNSVFNFSGPYHDVHNTLEEVNKPDQIEKISTVDIPFESDFDFWNMLDGLNSFQSSTSEAVQLNNIEGTSQSSSLGDVENRKWLRYLENELGLETKDESLAEDAVVADKQPADESFQYEPQVNSGLGYYHIWPSL